MVDMKKELEKLWSVCRRFNWVVGFGQGNTSFIGTAGKAAELLHTIPTAKIGNYAFMTEQLNTWFWDAHMKKLYRAQLRNRTQKVPTFK